MELLFLAFGVFGVWYLTRKGEQPTQSDAGAQKSGSGAGTSTGPAGRVVSSPVDGVVRTGKEPGSAAEPSVSSPDISISTGYSREGFTAKMPSAKTLDFSHFSGRTAEWPGINRLPEPWRTLTLKTVEGVNYGLLLAYELRCAGGVCPDPEDVQLQIDNLTSKKAGIEATGLFSKGTVDPAVSELEFLKYIMSIKKPTAEPTRPWTEFDVLPSSYRDMALTAVANINYDALFTSGVPIINASPTGYGRSVATTRDAVNTALGALDNSAARATLSISGVSEDDLNTAIALLQRVASALAGL